MGKTHLESENKSPSQSFACGTGIEQQFLSLVPRTRFQRLVSRKRLILQVGSDGLTSFGLLIGKSKMGRHFANG